MTNSKMTRLVLVILASLTIVESFGQNQNSNNWFTKSMDYFHYEECGAQDKSDLTAEFYGCLNSKSYSNDDKNDYTKYFKSYQGYMGGMSGGDKKTVDTDSWPFKTCDELQEILRCMPAIEKTECLTEKEHKFFSTLKYYFQAQSGYICSNKERISEAFEKSTCNYMKNRQDIQQQCFSLNAQTLSYDWKVNFEDGVMCRLLKSLKTCEESYYDSCDEQVKAYVRHSHDLPLQTTPCNSTLFEPMIDALSGDKSRSKRSVFNNQYGFKTADGNGNGYYGRSPYYQDQTDETIDNQKPNDLTAMFADMMSQMQRSGASAAREKRSIGDFMSFSPFGNKKSQDKKTDKSSDDSSNPMNFMDYNNKVNQDWASKFNSFGMGSGKDVTTKGSKKNDKKNNSKKVDSKKKPEVKKEEKDDNVLKEKTGDKSTNPIEMNKKINFDFANKFMPFRMKRSIFGGDDLPGMKQNQMFSDKFNPNPFFSNSDDKQVSSDSTKETDDNLNPIEKNKKINFDFAKKFGSFGRRRRSLTGAGLPGMKQDKDFNNKFNPNPFNPDNDNSAASKDDDNTAINPAEKQKNINDGFAGKFNPFVRSKRSADPYDESNPDEKDKSDDELNSDKSDEDKSTNEKQKEFSKKMNQKFADHYMKKMLGDKSKNKTEDGSDDDDKSPFGDLSKFVAERVKEQQKKEQMKKDAKSKKDDSVTLKISKPADKDEADDSDDDKEEKTDFMKDLQKFIKDQIKKEMEKEKEKEKEKKKDKKDKKKKEKLTEREKDELEREKERKQGEKERKKQKKEYEKEREKDELERKKEREQDEKERQKQKEELEKEKEKQKKEYEKEHGKETTTSAPLTSTESSASTTAEPLTDAPTTTSTASESTSEESTEAPTSVSDVEQTSTSEKSTEAPTTMSTASESTSEESTEAPTSVSDVEQTSTTDQSITEQPTDAPNTESTGNSTTDGKSEEEIATTQASTTDNTDSSTSRIDDEIV